MSDRNPLFDSNETPEDVATLYSWANLHGAKYRDFSASRAQTREKARQRVQEAIEAERRRVREEAEAQRIAEAQRAAEMQRQAEMEARVRAEQEAAERAAQLQQAAQQRVWAPAAGQVAPQAPAHVAYQPLPPPAPLYARPAPYSPPPSYAAPQAPAYQPPPAPYYAPQAPQAPEQPPQYQNYPPPQRYNTMAPAREQNLTPNRPWSPAGNDPRENATRPAWLADRNDVSTPPIQHAPEDTLQGSRDRITSRWFALKGVFAGATPATEPAPAPLTSRAPVVALFSLAGGVGKTSIAATLGRALAARGERVLLVDTAAFGLLPFFFGARDQRPGVLRTFTAPGNSGDAPVQLLTTDCDNLGPDVAGQEPLSNEVARSGHGASRVLVDIATASGAITRRVLRMNPTILVPVISDMSSVVSVSAIESFFQRNSVQPVMPFYVLNQFDPSLPLHLDVREVMREQLGERLLPFSLRRTPAVSEALAEGMTVVDYAPSSVVVEDFGALAGWVKSLAAPGVGGFRGVRWSER
ncbi:MAG TPA: cellulose synthase operon protein YhjQ/BcsQ [Terracidiphilus sp.]|jgi:cellulose synthase operon protein YhjQ